MLLSSMHVIPRSQTEEELNRNTVLLIAEAGRLIQGSKRLSDRLKSFEDPNTKRKVASATGNR